MRISESNPQSSIRSPQFLESSIIIYFVRHSSISLIKSAGSNGRFHDVVRTVTEDRGQTWRLVKSSSTTRIVAIVLICQEFLDVCRRHCRAEDVTLNLVAFQQLQEL